MDKIVARDKSYQGRGWIIAESGVSKPVAEGLTEREAKFIASCMNHHLDEATDIPSRRYW